jgi:hypothetical protein
MIVESLAIERSTKPRSLGFEYPNAETSGDEILRKHHESVFPAMQLTFWDRLPCHVRKGLWFIEGIVATTALPDFEGFVRARREGHPSS